MGSTQLELVSTENKGKIWGVCSGSLDSLEYSVRRNMNVKCIDGESQKEMNMRKKT